MIPCGPMWAVDVGTGQRGRVGWVTPTSVGDGYVVLLSVDRFVTGIGLVLPSPWPGAYELPGLMRARTRPSSCPFLNGGVR